MKRNGIFAAVAFIVMAIAALFITTGSDVPTLALCVDWITGATGHTDGIALATAGAAATKDEIKATAKALKSKLEGLLGEEEEQPLTRDEIKSALAEIKAAETKAAQPFAKKSTTEFDVADAPNIAQFKNLWKYDNIDPVDQAFMIDILDSAKGLKSTKGDIQAASENIRRSLAIKVLESKDVRHSASRHAMKMAGMPMKANELNQSTLASYGDEWVGETFSRDMWARIVQDTPVVGRIPTLTVPQGSESVHIPIDVAAPSFYMVSQASAQSANPGPTTHTVKTSRQQTSRQTLPVGTLGAATTWTGHLDEDSLLNFASELRRSIEQEGTEVLEHVIIDGDTATATSTNINDIAGTPAGDEAFLIFNGFRKLALVTNTANSRDGGTLAANDFLETLKLMGLGGRNASREQTAFILDLWTYWKALELSQVETWDKNSSPTIEEGMLQRIYGYDVIKSANMHRANTDATYGLKADATGKIDLDTASDNAKGALLAVRFDQWRLGYKRRITFEVERVPRADAYELTALMRVGLVNRDAEASAISYNLTV